ncbi:MAG: hypothetical protein ACRDPI_07745, partial [Nocardioidaceae bacterium]
RLKGADWDRIDALQAYADARGIGILDVAIGGLAAQPTVASVIAGVSRAEQVSANVRAAQWRPSEEELDVLAGTNSETGDGMTHTAFTRR